MGFITVETLADFANKFAAKSIEKFAKKEDMGGATVSQAGGSGLVPAPPAGAQGKFLRGDGTWQTASGATYSNATSDMAGLMSAEDKTKLDGLEEATTADIDGILADIFK